MTLVINLNDPSLWNVVWEFNIVATPISADNPEGSYIRIPEQNCPILLHNSLLAVYANNDAAKPGWFSAGYMTQKINLPLTVGGQPTSYGASRRIVLNRTQIVPFLDVGVEDFAISFLCHRWHRKIQLVVWEYTGEVSTQELVAIASVNQQLDVIESKIDGL